MDEAKKHLSVRSVRYGNQWFWQLPDSAVQETVNIWWLNTHPNMEIPVEGVWGWDKAKNTPAG